MEVLSRPRLKDILNLGMITAGIVLILYIVISSQLDDIALRFDDGDIGLSLDLSQNEYLVDMPRFARDDWNSIFVDQPRTAYPAYLSMPALDIDTTLLGVGIDPNGLIWAPPREAGHFMFSARPGEDENIVIVGHSGSGLIFEDMFEVDVNDEIIISDVEGTQYRYVVRETTILPVYEASIEQLEQNVSYVMPTGEEVLTIVTCYPRDAYTHRLIVRAYPE